MSLTVNYKGTQIAELTEDGNLTLNTAGKYCEGNIGLDYSGGGAPTPPETPTDAVIFYSPNAFTLQVRNRTKNWDGTLYSSTDYSMWNVWDGTTVLNAGEHNGYYALYLRGIGSTKIGSNIGNSVAFSLGGTQIKCCGNLNNLLDYTSNPTLASYAFASLFNGCGNVDFNVSLPATTLSTYCYYYMFSNCASLTTAPALPAETLTDHCYYYMFQNCTSLTTAPALPAETLASYCYYYMFQNCTSLVIPPDLPATTLTNYCYNGMFYGCSSLVTAPSLPATTTATYCYGSMFSGCASLVSITELPALSVASNAYGSMFESCSKIKLSTTQTGEYQTAYRIPTSGTGTTAAGNSLMSMFYKTGGTFNGTPTINTTYYTSNTVIPAS